ncbi:LysR family transcriptional regulator [Anaerotruncus rubiinfantis]|uniref:LysR family transcriptional regulator n=1 Tax=Anaerotruncus rubiinfantis TaxID=1720200 RepID=UPI0011CBAE4B|nr:LysR family transcriptional regulator [Anaerotruncus rubiinfantis]
MDIRQLRTFITFAEEQSLTKASMKLNYAVSTLSQHIEGLEQEFGVKFLERCGRHSQLTKCGEIFLVYARKMMELYKDSQQEMAYFAGVKGLRIITSESISLYTMPPIYTRFSQKYPEVELNVSIGNPATFNDKLRNDMADIAFRFVWNPTESKDLESMILFREEAVLIAPAKHYLTRKKNIQPEDFDKQVFIFPQKDSLYREVMNRILSNKNISIKSKLYMDSGSTIKKCVEMGQGLSMLPISIVKNDIEAGNIAKLDWGGAPFAIFAEALILKKDWIMPAVREIMNLCAQSFQNSKNLLSIE